MASAEYHIRRVLYALNCANKAVECDIAMKWGEALVYYRAAYGIMVTEAGSNLNTKEVAALLSKKAETYLYRIDDLKAVKVPPVIVPDDNGPVTAASATHVCICTAIYNILPCNSFKYITPYQYSVTYFRHTIYVHMCTLLQALPRTNSAALLVPSASTNFKNPFNTGWKGWKTETPTTNNEPAPPAQVVNQLRVDYDDDVVRALDGEHISLW